MLALIEANLSEMQAAVYDCNVSNGWFDSGRSSGTDRALLHTEVAEMFEAFRDWGTEDKTGEKCLSDFDGIHLHGREGVAECKPEGVGSEAADVLVRWLDTATRQDFDVVLAHTSALNMDWPELLDPESEFGDWCDLLHRAIADTAGSPICQPQTAFAATLSILLAGCQRWGIDLLAEFDRKLAFNRTRGYKHGGKSV